MANDFMEFELVPFLIRSMKLSVLAEERMSIPSARFVNPESPQLYVPLVCGAPELEEKSRLEIAEDQLGELLAFATLQ